MSDLATPKIRGMKMLGSVDSYEALHELMCREAKRLKLWHTAMKLIAKIEPRTIKELGPHTEVMGPVNDYEDLHEFLRAQAERLQISRAAIDILAHLQPGYAAKLLAPKPIKRLGRETFEFMLPALGIKLVAIEDVQSLEQIRRRAKTRNASQVREAAKYTLTFTRKFLQKIAKKGGKARMERAGVDGRREHMRHMALCRWRKRAAS